MFSKVFLLGEQSSAPDEFAGLVLGVPRNWLVL
jgi:hypothetical protein